MVITRFAPSPTGYLHVGGARTALYSWLFARKHQGKAMLRIEDTDTDRNDAKATQAIIDAMDWLGLSYDIGPIFQSKRFDTYRQYALQLLETNHAYWSYCTPEQLDAMRAEQEANKEKPRYIHDAKFEVPQFAGQQPVLRFKNPTSGKVSFHDAVRGLIEVDNSELDDLVILRSNGAPTYNFCVVVDDILGEITHVIRGEDHINNTFRQINIFKAFGSELPIFAHVSMINGDDGKKLSKRHGAVSVMEYKANGYLPAALLNYLLRLGWGYGNQEIFSLEEMIELFSLEAISKSSSSFDFKKLDWLNQYYLKQLSPQDLAAQVKPFIKFELNDKIPLTKVVPLYVDRAVTLLEIADSCSYLYNDPQYNQSAVNKHLLQSKSQLQLLHSKLSVLDLWTNTNIHLAMKATANELSLGMMKIGMPFRVAITGVDQTPGIDKIAELLGKDQTLHRLTQVINTL